MAKDETLEEALARHKAEGIISDDITLENLMPMDVTERLIKTMVETMEGAIELLDNANLLPPALVKNARGHHGVARMVLGEQLFIACSAWIVISNTNSMMPQHLLEEHVKNIGVIYEQSYRLLSEMRLQDRVKDGDTAH